MKLLVFIMIALLFGCASGIQLSAISPMGLKTFPLDTATKDIVFKANGPPKRTFKLPNGNEAWVYEFLRDFGQKTYTVEFLNGKVIDVLYNDRGPYNGTTARGLQNINK